MAEHFYFLDSFFYSRKLLLDDQAAYVYAYVNKSEELISGLSSHDPKIRWNAAANLGIMRCEESVPYLIKSLKNDEMPQVRMLAAWSLGRIGTSEALSPLIEALEDDAVDVKTLSIWAIGELRQKEGAAALEKIGEVSKETGTLQLCLESLGKIHNYSSVPVIAGLLKNPDPHIRKEAARKLGLFNEQQSIDALIGALDDSHPEVVCISIRSLRFLKDKKSFVVLKKLLKSPDPVIVKEAEITLSGSCVSDEKLKRSLTGFGDAKEAYYSSLYQYSRPDLDIGDISKMNPEDSHDIATLPIQLGKKFDLDEAVRELDSEFSDFRSDAAWKMGNSGDKSVVPYLIKALNDKDYNVRWNAAKALGKLKDLRAVEPLLASMEDPEKDVREDVVEALGRLRDPRAEKKLVFSLQFEPEGYIRAEAVIALELIGCAGKHINKIIAALEDECPPVRANAALVIGCEKKKEAIPLLEKLKSDESQDVRAAAARALDALKNNKQIDIIYHYHED
jgi:HEAT repeat protein